VHESGRLQCPGSAQIKSFCKSKDPNTNLDQAPVSFTREIVNGKEELQMRWNAKIRGERFLSDRELESAVFQNDSNTISLAKAESSRFKSISEANFRKEIKPKEGEKQLLTLTHSAAVQSTRRRISQQRFGAVSGNAEAQITATKPLNVKLHRSAGRGDHVSEQANNFRTFFAYFEKLA
jgi:hypothetical protein